jgi:hypothetical protein
VLNGLVIITFIERLRHEGKKIVEAVEEGAYAVEASVDDRIGRFAGICPDGNRDRGRRRGSATAGDRCYRRHHFFDSSYPSGSSRTLRPV